MKRIRAVRGCLLAASAAAKRVSGAKKGMPKVRMLIAPWRTNSRMCDMTMKCQIASAAAAPSKTRNIWRVTVGTEWLRGWRSSSGGRDEA